MERMLEVRYAIDASDRLVELNEGWEAFARANDGEELESARVLGHVLWEYISGDLTLHLYRTMVRNLRGGAGLLRFTFRCDAPARRRLLAMEMAASPGDRITFRVTSLREQDRPSIPFLELHPDMEPGPLTVCSWCERVWLPPDRWVGAETAMEWFSEVDVDPGAQLTHGMCPDCYTEMSKRLVDCDCTSNAGPGDFNPT